MGWNNDRIELLKKLWADGLSASQIAAKLGGVTRNAVIGKVHRLGLSGRVKTPSAVVPKARKPRKDSTMVLTKKHRVAPELEMPLIDHAIIFTVPMGKKVSILELSETTCRWPIGEPSKPDFGYCGAQPKGELPYCSYHARAAYQPAADRRRARTAALHSGTTPVMVSTKAPTLQPAALAAVS